MKVLIIDDKDEQLEIAAKLATERGWEVVTDNPTANSPGKDYAELRWTDLMTGVDGVITDLMWDHYHHGEKPQGLLVVIHALSLRKPVVICTSSGDYNKGHHGEAIGFINDGYRTSVHPCPFGWEEDKRWNKAMDLLAERLPKTETHKQKCDDEWWDPIH